MILVKNSSLKHYFDFEEDILGEIFVLDPAEAKSAWGQYFESNARGLHDLPNTSWVVRQAWNKVGTWIDAYNGLNDPQIVLEAIEKTCKWRRDEPLLLFKDSLNIVAITFGQFGMVWRQLFAAFDDGPIIVGRGENDCVAAFQFAPLGEILYTSFFLS